MSKNVLPLFFSKSFVVSTFAFRFLINFEFIFVYGIISKYSESVVKVLVAHSCLTLCDPMDYSLSGYSVHGIL